MTELMIRDNAGQYQLASPEQIVAAARHLRETQWRPEKQEFTNPRAVRDFLDLQLAEREQEVFCVLFLDCRHRLITYEEMFQGTLNSAAVYPREVVKRALALNAGAVILSHNHPSGDVSPSDADRRITTRLVEALELVECRVLDHFIFAGDGSQAPFSFAENGLI